MFEGQDRSTLEQLEKQICKRKRCFIVRFPEITLQQQAARSHKTSTRPQIDFNN